MTKNKKVRTIVTVSLAVVVLLATAAFLKTKSIMKQIIDNVPGQDTVYVAAGTTEETALVAGAEDTEVTTAEGNADTATQTASTVSVSTTAKKPAETTTKKQTTTTKPSATKAPSAPKSGNNFPYELGVWTTWNGHEGYFDNYADNMRSYEWADKYLYEATRTGEYAGYSEKVGTYDDLGTVYFLYLEPIEDDDDSMLEFY